VEAEKSRIGLRDQAKSDRLRRIHEAATELLLDRTFQEITTKDIAERAQVGEATLFRYIKNKQRLLTMVYGDLLDQILDAIEAEEARIVADHGSLSMTGEQYVARVLATYRQRCRFYLAAPTNAALYLREGFDPESPEKLRHLAQGDRSIRLTAAILTEGQQAAVIRRDVDAAVIAQNCHGTYIHEIDRTPVRGFEPSTIWDRIRVRLEAQLRPLVLR
jgi:AcrR family transcriptional regulator